jgi:hypothetical protein
MSCNPSYAGGRYQGDGGSKPVQANSLKDPVSKNLTQKKADRVVQMVECLPSKHEALSSNSSAVKKKKKRGQTQKSKK